MTTEWRESALCAETAPDLFFPAKGESSVPAKRICARCEVGRSVGAILRLEWNGS